MERVISTEPIGAWKSRPICGKAGKSADCVYLRPPAGSPLAAAVERAESPERVLGALVTLAGPESVAEVRIAGATVYRTASPAA